MHATPPPSRYTPPPVAPAAQVRPAEAGTGPQHHREDLYKYVEERQQEASDAGREWVEQKQQQEKILRKLDNAAERARTEQARKPGHDRNSPQRQRKR